MRVWIGCGGYTNDDWTAPGLIYEGVKKDAYLETYSHYFDAVELNSSFYAIPGIKAFEGMVRKSGGRTRFAVKLNKVFTHERTPTDADFDRMLQSPEPLREAGVMGPYLAQFPYSFHRTGDNRKYLLGLAERFAGHELAVELRHASWDKPEVREGMAEHGLIWVSPDYPPVGGMPEPQVHVTTDVGYLRLHGRNKGSWWEGQSASERHDYLYTRAEMDEWAEKIALVADDLSELYVFFENTTRGHALKNIPMLREALNARGVPVRTPEPGEEGRLL
ncbi:DUF72 domain-containing protein [Deinococcus metallilatus]|uniref:DUF72 domain-containing protein n=1 Tax=Deinococcus metallilatus TaxID=1211322 RepID=A0AAJ5K3A2_9DEIO|nr:DUF72 domain-containing protein [Deinococcus metallilatus]MBB5297256.1 uncharacterized protein YecE (DUF72 family) [Deinococcus metallilatus]QBY09672.1 DUF72 domain-containing protein [Deinococcus metallilatus]RXJ09044.1 DUF72 domain-containing protein [Deinococcus metallilatus]TLK21299.1 DUF72 domain-containing protein [Deinococcus metallilatus]GMA17199.1 hypothetical protein GCM10025871_35300 [Deinococcus metallilatus]